MPATIAVKDGVCRIGLTDVEITDLAISGEEKRTSKCSTRDLPVLLAKIETSRASTSDAGHQWGGKCV